MSKQQHDTFFGELFVGTYPRLVWAVPGIALHLAGSAVIFFFFEMQLTCPNDQPTVKPIGKAAGGRTPSRAVGAVTTVVRRPRPPKKRSGVGAA